MRESGSREGYAFQGKKFVNMRPIRSSGLILGDWFLSAMSLILTRQENQQLKNQE
jgi:hypothetical protein